MLERRTPLRRTGGPRRASKPLPATSTRRDAENALRRRVVDRLRKAEPWCHARAIRACTNRPDDAHEIVTRARGGSITDPANIMLVCRPCHDWITAHPVQAAERGFVRWSWERGLRSEGGGC